MRLIILTIIWVIAQAHISAASPVRIKDIADFDGVRGNDLVGYGLVVGLNGTGDSLRNAPFTEEILSGLLERLGVNVVDDALRSKNVAAVVVTAELPPFARTGSRIDVNVATIGDSKSLLGGTLVMTPLKAADGNIYAVAQGSIISGGTAVGGQAARVVEGVPTAGSVPAGARVEREVAFDFSQIQNIRIALRNPDFTTAIRLEGEIDKAFKRNIAEAQDSGTIIVEFKRLGAISPAQVLGRIENLQVEPDDRAKVIIDHKTGTIVLGEHVRVSNVAVSQGNLTLRVVETPEVVQPNPFSPGETVVVPRSSAEILPDQGTGFVELTEGTSLSELVQGLNALGVGPRDMVDILKSIHAAGALHADFIVV